MYLQTKLFNIFNILILILLFLDIFNVITLNKVIYFGLVGVLFLNGLLMVYGAKWQYNKDHNKHNR
ncbi:hypothetical protein [Macrococcus animalis]|uniref:hypothetical protein n=1 Tax=Macrococcus animalis TaxID=3395467 RepID=UPI0039BDB144